MPVETNPGIVFPAKRKVVFRDDPMPAAAAGGLRGYDEAAFRVRLERGFFVFSGGGVPSPEASHASFSKRFSEYSRYSTYTMVVRSPDDRFPIVVFKDVEQGLRALFRDIVYDSVLIGDVAAQYLVQSQHLGDDYRGRDVGP